VRKAGRVPGEPFQIRIRAASGEDPRVAFGKGTAALTLERAADNSCPTARGTRIDDLVDEVDKLLWKPNCDLLTHPKTVPNR
jgi:hypothetical protein